MTSVEGNNKVVGKSVRKISLEGSSPKPSDGEAKTLRRVRSDSLAPAAPTFLPKFLKDEKNHSPRKKKVNLDPLDAALPQSKKPPSGRRRKSSVHQEMVLDVAALHKLRKEHEGDDRVSIYSSMQSVKTSPSPSPDLSLPNQNGDQSNPSPTFHITYSPNTEDHVTFEKGSNASSVYHSSCIYPQEEGPKLLGHLLEDPRKTLNHSKRRMSSPIIKNLKRQQLQDGSYTLTKVSSFPDEGYRHSSQDVSNLMSFELTALPSKSKFYSTQEDLSTITCNQASTQQRNSSDPIVSQNKLNASPKGFRKSFDSQIEINHKQDSNKELADQNCRSNFGIVLSAICFVLFLWYLAMVSSEFIKSALSFESFNTIPSIELGSIHEVTVYITAGD